MLSTLKIIFTVGLVIAILMIALELVLSKIKKKRVYTLADTLTNLSSGMIERSFDVFCAIGFFFIFNAIYQLVPWKIPPGIFTWFIALLVTDLLAYWHHRLSHEINFLWAAHVVHHQSEELNVTTVFRVSFVAVINRALFFILMPIVGFDPLTIASTAMVLGIYQFFTHFRFINKVGILETFMTTPSHHRVHHSRDAKYLDKNYAHIFIFWDRLFGTFMAEEEEPNYGITSGFESSNAFVAQFSYWKNLFTRANRTKGVKNKLSVFLKGPDFTPEDVEHLPPEYKTDEEGKRIPYRQIFSIERSAYILVSVLTTFSLFFLLTRLIVQKPEGSDVSINQAELFMQEAYSFLFQPYVLILIGLILFSILSHGFFMDHKKGSGLVDGIRLIAIALIMPIVFSNMENISPYLTTAVFVSTALMALWLIRLKWFDKKLSPVN